MISLRGAVVRGVVVNLDKEAAADVESRHTIKSASTCGPQRGITDVIRGIGDKRQSKVDVSQRNTGRITCAAAGAGKSFDSAAADQQVISREFLVSRTSDIGAAVSNLECAVSLLDGEEPLKADKIKQIDGQVTGYRELLAFVTVYVEGDRRTNVNRKWRYLIIVGSAVRIVEIQHLVGAFSIVGSVDQQEKRIDAESQVRNPDKTAVRYIGLQSSILSAVNRISDHQKGKLDAREIEADRVFGTSVDTHKHRGDISTD